MLKGLFAVGLLASGAWGCCLENVSMVEYELAIDNDVLTFQTYDSFGDFYDWIQTYLVRGDFKDQINIGRRKSTWERRQDKLVLINRGNRGNAPERSDLRYFKSFGEVPELYQNMLEWRIDLEPDENCSMIDVSVPDLYARKLVEEVNQFVWVMPCMPDASNCTHGASRQESAIEFHRMSIYGENIEDGQVVVDLDLWATEEWDDIKKDMNQYFNGFSNVYRNAQISVRYSYVFHRVCRWPLKIRDENGVVVAEGVLEMQARYDSYEDFMDDIPSDHATQVKFILYEDGAVDFDLAREILEPIVDYTGNRAVPFVDHRDCVECCVGNESFAEYEVEMDSDYLAQVGSYNAFDEIIAWMESELQNDVFSDQFRIRVDSKMTWERVKDVLVMIKRGTKGVAPSKSFLKYKMSISGDEYQNEFSWVIELEDDCSWPANITETEMYDIEENGVKRTIDQNVWVMPCNPNSQNCTHDVFTFASKYQFDENPMYGTGHDDAVYVVDLPDAFNITEFDEICPVAEQFWEDFCDFYEGSRMDVRYRRVWHRFATLFVDFYVNGRKIARGRIDFQARYETYDDFMNDIPSDDATQFKVRIFQWRTEPEFWGEVKYLASTLIDYIAEMAVPWVDHRECPTDMPTMAPVQTCCRARNNAPARWEANCAGYMNRRQCQKGPRAQYCAFAAHEDC